MVVKVTAVVSPFCLTPPLLVNLSSRLFPLTYSYVWPRLDHAQIRASQLKPSGVWEQGTVLPSSKTLHNAFSIISRFHSTRPTRPTRPAYTDGLNYANGILIGGLVFDTYSSLGISSIRASFRRYLADIPKS